MIPKRAFAKILVSMFLVDRVMQLMNGGGSKNPSPDPAPIPGEFRMLTKIDEFIDDEEGQQDAVRNVQKRQRRHQEQHPRKSLGRMCSERCDEIQFGR